MQILVRSAQRFIQSLNNLTRNNRVRESRLFLALRIMPIVLIMSGLMFVTPTLAAIETPMPSPPLPVPLGERIFKANCAACHIGGNNIIISEKNLSKDALAKYEMNSIAAIKTQVTLGKNAMPAFGDNLNSAEIEAVARYVLTQSQEDWKRSSVGLQRG